MPKKNLAKLFVLDTNVILHDSSCITHFEENDIAIPITVLEELDNFKRGNEQIHFNARDFLRILDELTGDQLFEVGVSIGKSKGNIRVIIGKDWHPKLRTLFTEDTPDHRILNVALWLKEDNKGTELIIVSKDTNLRMKAKSLGIPAQDYTTDKVESVEKIYTGVRMIEGMETEFIDALYNSNNGVALGKAIDINDATPNENFILRNKHKSALATYDGNKKQLLRVNKQQVYGIMPRNAEQSFAVNALINPNLQLITLSGKAGTGKTLLALAAALERRKEYRQIYLARPIVPLSNRDIGYLPGDIKSKLDPYMQPLFDNLSVILHQFSEKDGRASKLTEMLDKEKLVITPLAYIRGRSFQKVFFIIDEAQNLTPHEVKTIITRAGEGTKIVFTGDIHQIDHPYLDTLSNGLSFLINRMVGQVMYAHITLKKGERSALAELASDLL
jgi:PhoH-like ATPase